MTNLSFEERTTVEKEQSVVSPWTMSETFWLQPTFLLYGLVITRKVSSDPDRMYSPVSFHDIVLTWGETRDGVYTAVGKSIRNLIDRVFKNHKEIKNFGTPVLNYFSKSCLMMMFPFASQWISALWFTRKYGFYRPIQIRFVTSKIRPRGKQTVDLRKSVSAAAQQFSVCCHSVDQYFINTCSLPQRLLVTDSLSSSLRPYAEFNPACRAQIWIWLLTCSTPFLRCSTLSVVVIVFLVECRWAPPPPHLMKD